MTVLLATADGRVAAGRTVRWSGVVTLPAAAAAAAALGRATAGPGAGRLGDAALVVAAAALAFAADDVSWHAAPATPVGTRARLAARLAVAAPVVAVGWLACLALLGGGGAEVVDRAPGAVALALAATATAAAVDRLAHVASPGAAGAALAGCAAIAAPLAVPDGWWPDLASGGGPVAAVAVAVAAAALLRAATAEPPAR